MPIDGSNTRYQFPRAAGGTSGLSLFNSSSSSVESYPEPPCASRYSRAHCAGCLREQQGGYKIRRREIN
ncbi:hypothetical protein E2C01_003927 [Portunus trituberculatus]|uniref:Uncharacterized protein n=1 Tax=Portunus trituberculatus TaxID=210409 RepID=A0A5B7CSG2_PORTR|nr:hypothetical protein [Portunus trituberculatus]